MRVAKVFKEVQAAWRRCSGPMRRKVRSWAMMSRDADFRLRCKIVWNLVRGQSTQRISEVLGCFLGRDTWYLSARSRRASGKETL